MNDSRIRIVAYRDEYQPDFARLNREWLEAHGLLEDADLAHLDDPRGSFVEPGGEVLILLRDDAVIGTAALMPPEENDGATWGLYKLAVDRQARGQGFGERLVRAVIDRARRRGADRIALSSSSKLEAAIRLYRRMGFVPVAEGAAAAALSGYESCDIVLALDLVSA